MHFLVAGKRKDRVESFRVYNASHPGCLFEFTFEMSVVVDDQARTGSFSFIFGSLVVSVAMIHVGSHP